MLELPHAMVGAAIAAVFPNPLISLPLSLTSHFVLDYIPHWEPHITSEKRKLGHFSFPTFIIVTIDSLLALSIGTYLALKFLPNTGQFLNILACSFTSVAPDVVEIPYFIFNRRPRWIMRLLKFQSIHQHNTGIFWGGLTQVIIIFASLTVIYFTLSA
jgi:hypothetical protein